MSHRLSTVAPSPIADAGITVAMAAEILGADPSTVRALVDCGELEGWRVGKTRKPTGIRVSEGSCWDYRRRHLVAKPVQDDPPPAARPRPSRHTGLLKRTIDSLRAKGVRV